MATIWQRFHFQLVHIELSTLACLVVHGSAIGQSDSSKADNNGEKRERISKSLGEALVPVPKPIMKLYVMARQLCSNCMQHKDVIHEWQGVLEFFCCNMLGLSNFVALPSKHATDGLFLEQFLIYKRENKQKSNSSSRESKSIPHVWTICQSNEGVFKVSV